MLWYPKFNFYFRSILSIESGTYLWSKLSQYANMARLLVILALLPLVVIGIFHLLHVLYFAGTYCSSRAMLTGKTVIVTGANTGIGRTTALDMAARGARVILACRSEARTKPALEEIRQKTKNDQVLFMPLDLASTKSIRNFVSLFLEQEERLDILINNAGLISSDEPKYNDDGIELTMAVNHLGPFLLTNLLLDLMKRSSPGARIVNVSSGLYNFANPLAFQDDFEALKTDGTAGYFESLNLDHLENSHLYKLLYYVPNSIKQRIVRSVMTPKRIRYNNSKLANVLFTVELARRLAGTGINAYSLHPGVIKTEIGLERDPISQKSLGIEGGFLKDFRPLHIIRKTLEGGAQTTICCAVDEKLANESGRYYSDCAAVEVRRPEFYDADLNVRFWEWSAKLTGLEN